MYVRIYIYIHRNRRSLPASVGLAQARPNYDRHCIVDKEKKIVAMAVTKSSSDGKLILGDIAFMKQWIDDVALDVSLY